MSERPPYRTALVTGATSGIGRAVVVRLRAMGLEVVALGRDAVALERLRDETGAEPLRADVRDADAVVEGLGGREVDILVNNAGILSTRANFAEIDPAEIDAMIDVNLRAPLHLTRRLLPGMVARRRGHLVFLGSTGGHSPFPSMAVYGASKAGLSLFCDNLRLDLLGSSVRVTEVVPGRVRTDLYRDALGRDEAKTALYDGYRPVEPDHVARLVGAVIDLPAEVDVSRIDVLPTDQASGGGTMVKFQPSN